MTTNLYLWPDVSYYRAGSYLNSGNSGVLFAGLVAFLFLCLLAYLATEEWLLLVLPTGLVALAWGIRDFRLLYLAIWATIPFAVEVDLPGGLVH